MGTQSIREIKRFFLNGHLHAKLHISRSMDQITAYDYIDCRKKVYPYSEVKKRAQNAFTITEAAELVGRHRDRIVEYIERGIIETPQREHRIGDQKPWRYFLSEDDMMDLRDAMAEMHHGRPRKDGKVTNNRTPTREQMRALVSRREMMYNEVDGEFRPVWQQETW